jgi:hypothetical protein
VVVVLGIMATWSEDVSGASFISISDVHGLLKPSVMLPEESLTAPTQDWLLAGYVRVAALKVDTAPPDPVELPKLLVMAVGAPKAREREPKTPQLI